MTPRVVDVGCGNGEVLARLRELRMARGAADVHAIGLDPDAPALEFARARHAAVLDAAPPEAVLQDASWLAQTADDALDSLAPWHGALCLGSRHAFGPDAEAAARMITRLRDGLEAPGALLLADGIWRQAPHPDYLAATGLQAEELLSREAWLERFAAADLDLVHEEQVTPDEFEAYEQFFWAQGGEHWRNWADAFRRWGKQTMGFAAWVLTPRAASAD